MIPSIETICEDLKAGTITVQQAIAWLRTHAEGAVNERLEILAGLALQGILANPVFFTSSTFQGDVAAAGDKAIDAARYLMSRLP